LTLYHVVTWCTPHRERSRGVTGQPSPCAAVVAEQGVFTYANGRQANLFNIYAACNAARGTSFPASVSQMNAMTKGRFSQVAGYRQTAGGLSNPALQRSDPNLRQWEWQYPNSSRNYYPTFRVDYNLSSNWRLNVSYNQTTSSAPYANAEHWPGDGRGAGNNSNNISLAVGLETVIRPNLLNQVRAGYLYTRAAFGQGGSDGFCTNPTIQYGYGGHDDNYEMPNSRQRPAALRDAEWTDQQLLGAPRLPSRHRRLRSGELAELERRRVLDAGRVADVLWCVRPGLLAPETELHAEHGPALGLRFARHRPYREVSLPDAPGSLRPDGRRQPLQSRSGVADRNQ
jgi:hypothetical protein